MRIILAILAIPAAAMMPIYATYARRAFAALPYEQLARLQNDAGSLLVMRLGPTHRRSRRLSDCFRAVLLRLT